MGKSESLLDWIETGSVSTLEQYTEQRLNSENNPVRAVTFISESRPVNLFPEFDPKGFSINIGYREEFIVGSLTRRLKGQGEEYDENGYRHVEGEFYLFAHDESKSYTAFTISDDDFYKNGLKRYLQSVSQDISLSFLESKDLRQFFEAFDDSFDGNITATRAVIKSPSKTDVRYFDDTPYYDVFNSKEVSEEDYYVDKIEFEIRESSHEFNGPVSRSAESRYMGGESTLYFNMVLAKLASLISDKGDIFADRAREYGSRESEPIQIMYRERGQLKDERKTSGSFAHWTVSVNPQ